jgi:preprotein translocase subunit SecE
MKLSIYQFKPDQGRITRGVAFWLAMPIAYYGCYTLYFFLNWDWAKSHLVEGIIPIVNIPMDVRLLVSVAVFLGLAWMVIWLINRPKLGGLLVETETEMKKVTWPSWGESFNSSIVVLISVVFFLIFFLVADSVLTQIFRKFIFRG